MLFRRNTTLMLICGMREVSQSFMNMPLFHIYNIYSSPRLICFILNESKKYIYETQSVCGHAFGSVDGQIDKQKRRVNLVLIYYNLVSDWVWLQIYRFSSELFRNNKKVKYKTQQPTMPH